MGLIHNLVSWLDHRKENANSSKQIKFNRRKGIDLITHNCKECGNDKAWYKMGRVKCTKCGERDVI